MNISTELYNLGFCDGYNGSEPTSETNDYMAGYHNGDAEFLADQAEAHFADEASDYDYEMAISAAYADAEADFWDYEPSPYDGTYSEM